MTCTPLKIQERRPRCICMVHLDKFIVQSMILKSLENSTISYPLDTKLFIKKIELKITIFFNADKAQKMTTLSCLSHVKRTSNNKRPPAPPLYTFTELIVDRSGSMDPIWKAGVAGIEDLIKEQQDLAKKTGAIAKISLTTFATNTTTYWDNIPLESVTMPFTGDQKQEYFSPTDMTRLVDTQMERIIVLKRRIRETVKALPKHIRALKPKVVAVFVVQTDGQDNMSMFRPRDLEMQMQSARKMGIQPIFLGANQDAQRVGATFGYAANACATFASTPAATQGIYRSVSAATARACSGGQATMPPTHQTARSAPAPQVRAWPPNNAIMAGAVLAPMFGGGGGGRGVSHGGGYMAQPLMPPPPRPTNCRQISVAYN